MRNWLTRDNLPWIMLALVGLLMLLLVSGGNWRSSGVGSQVQVPMFYDAHYLFPRPWTQEQAAPGIPEDAPVALYGSNQVSQTFRAGSDHLSMTSLWLAGPNGAQIEAVLSDDQGNSWQQTVELRGGQNGREISIAWPVITESRGRLFELTLSAPQAAAELPVILRSVGGDRVGGSLRLNEFIRPGNLALHTYASGVPGRWWVDALLEQLLPSAFRLRLQQYKTEPFKGPLFIWMFLLSAGLSALLLVAAAPDVMKQRERGWSSVLRAGGWFVVLLLGTFMIWQLGSGRLRLQTDVSAGSAVAGTASDPLLPGASYVMADLVSDLWTAEREPEARFVSTDIVAGLPAVRVPAQSDLRYPLVAPQDGRLRLATVAQGDGELAFSVLINDQIASTTTVTAQQDIDTQEFEWLEVDLRPWSGESAVLTLRTRPLNGDAEGLWLVPQVLTQRTWALEDVPDEGDWLPSGARFAETAELVGVLVDESAVASGELLLSLLWRPLQATEREGKVFVHLLDESGAIIAQRDTVPVDGVYPFAIWAEEELIRDDYSLSLPDNLAPGTYQIGVGIYDPQTLQRWPAANEQGTALPDNRALIDIVLETQP